MSVTLNIYLKCSWNSQFQFQFNMLTNGVTPAVPEALVHLNQAGFTLTYEWVICSQLHIYPRFFCLFSKSTAVRPVNASQSSDAAACCIEFLPLFRPPPPRAPATAVTGGESLTDEVSFSEQLLQVIDDLIRMLPAAQRLTLKDFPYAVAQTAGEAPRSSAAKKHFLTVFFVWEVERKKKMK